MVSGASLTKINSSKYKNIPKNSVNIWLLQLDNVGSDAYKSAVHLQVPSNYVRPAKLNNPQ